MAWDDEIGEIGRRRRLALQQGGADAVARQHSRGRLTVRERIDRLLDPASFSEVGIVAGSAEPDGGFAPANYVLGFGRIDGRQVVVGGEDFTIRGGSPTVAGLRKSVYAEDLALHYRLPLVRLHEGAGGSVAGNAGTGREPPPPDPAYAMPRFASVARTLATVPVAAAALGAVAGLPASRLVASHFSVMTAETAQVLTAGPAVVARALGEELTKEQLGGARVHGRNGTVDNVATDEDDALAQIRRFLSYLPANVWQAPPVAACDDPADRAEDALASIVPRERRRTFDMRRLVRLVMDRDGIFEIGRGWGQGIVTLLARLGGRPIAVFANDSRFYAGAMTADGAQKLRRFLELAATFHLPVVTFVDEPGFMIGMAAEHAATIRYGTAAVLTAATMRVPWATVLVRKSFGVAAVAHFAPHGWVLAWPSSERGALPVEGGVAVAYAREIAAAPDPEARRRELEDELAARQSPFPRAEAFAVHDLIDPRETRPRLVEWLERSWPLVEADLGPPALYPKP